MPLGLDQFMSWRWMPCFALSVTALGFVAVAVVLAPRPERTVTLSAASLDVNLTSTSNNQAPSSNDDASARTQGLMARRGFRSAEPGRRLPAVPSYATPGSGYAVPPTPYSDAVPAQPRNLVARASYGMQRFAEVAKVKVTAEAETGAPSAGTGATGATSGGPQANVAATAGGPP